MSKKNYDNHNRWRNKTVAFRVSAEEDLHLEALVKLTCLLYTSQTLRRHLGADLAAVVLRVVVTPAVVLLLGDLTGLQFGYLFPPSPKHFVQPGSILVFAEIYLQGKLTILLRDLQPVVVLQSKQGVHEPYIGVYIRDGKGMGRDIQYRCV